MSAAPFDLKTIDGCRAFLTEFFVTRLQRHDFTPYINGPLAGDFASALSAWLSCNKPVGAGAHDLPLIGGYASVGFSKNGKLTVNTHASRDMACAEAEQWEQQGCVAGVRPIIVTHGQVVQSPVARVVSKHGDPEAFGEREIEFLVDLATLPYNTNLFADANPGEVEKLRFDLATANEKIDKAWNRCSNLDHQGYIPGAMNAWKQPVKQHLPYDFSGNPGASSTQYCNGWNDAGAYWKNHADDLTAKQAELEALLREVRSTCSSKHVEMIDAAIGAPPAPADATHYYPAVTGDRMYRKQIDGIWHEFCGQWLPLDTQDMAHLYVELDAAPPAIQEPGSLNCGHPACDSLGEPHPFCEFAKSHEASAPPPAVIEDEDEDLPPVNSAMTNERCAYGVCDEADDHDPLCTAWDEAEQVQQLVEPYGWVVNSPEGSEPVEAFVRNKATVEKFRQSGWTITAVTQFAELEKGAGGK